MLIKTGRGIYISFAWRGIHFRAKRGEGDCLGKILYNLVVKEDR